MKLRLFTAICMLLLCVAARAAEPVPVTGAPGASLRALEGTPTLVTVVLKGGAKDANLQILEVHDRGITVLTSKGEPIPYLYDSIAEIQVQGGEIQKREIQVKSDVLPAPAQEVVDRALARCQEIFSGSAADQETKIEAATVLAAADNQDAAAYLNQLLESNDLQAQMDAARALYLAGLEVPQRVIQRGLESGVRKIRGTASLLAGELNLSTYLPMLKTMMQDRTPEISGPAARAVARLGDREAVPYLLTMLGSRDEIKGDAAVWALAQLNPPGLGEQLRVRLQKAEGMERFRIVLVLHAIKDPDGRKLLMGIFRDVPTLSFDAALILASEDKEWEALEYLRGRLNRREDETETNLVNRARTAAALLSSGDPQAKAAFQELLRSDMLAVKRAVYNGIIAAGDHRLLTIVRVGIEATDARAAMAASKAAAAIGYPRFRERLLSLPL
jgi:HEAT repeat protein